MVAIRVSGPRRQTVAYAMRELLYLVFALSISET
jgi:hypothetical protein